MPFSSNYSAYERATPKQLTDVLLRQLQNPMKNDAQLDLSFDSIWAIAEAVDVREPLPAVAETVMAALKQVIATSRAWFAGRNLTFEQALLTDMKDMPGWESTADFLTLANYKSNHELRVATAAAALMMLGDRSEACVLLFLLKHPQRDEVSAIMARRTLAIASSTEPQTKQPTWLAQVTDWLGEAGRCD